MLRATCFHLLKCTSISGIVCEPSAITQLG
nr:MAG TPA: hypothetical protein [Caudoviricetes sp.]